MEGILGGLGAALAWGVSVMLSSRSTKVVGGPGAAGTVHLIGIPLIAVACAVAPPGGDVQARHVVWAIAGGAGAVVGSTLLIWSVRHGKVAVVTPIVSASGALSAAGAVLLGESIGGPTVGLLAVVVAGVIAVAAGGEAAVDRSPARAGTGALLLATGSSLGYALAGLAAGKAAAGLPLPWVILPSRILGVLLVTAPLLARGRLVVSRAALPYLVGAAVLDLAGYLAYAWGMRTGIAVPAVLAGLFAAVAAVGGWLLFRERLTRLQTAGIALILAGVAGLAAAGT